MGNHTGKQVQVRWPQSLWDDVKEEAWKRRMSVSELTRTAVVEYCKFTKTAKDYENAE